MSDDESSGADYYNVIMLGDAGVGKTTFFLAVRDKRVTRETQSTVGVDFINHSAKLFTGRGTPTEVSVRLTDTAGQEKFAVLNRVYYAATDAAIIMFDVASKNDNSLKRALTAYNTLRAENQNNAVVCFVGNKEDALDPTTANRQRGRACKYIADNMRRKLDTAITFTSLHDRGFEAAIEILDGLVELAVQRREIELQRDKQREIDAAAKPAPPRPLLKQSSVDTRRRQSGHNGKLKLKRSHSSASANGSNQCGC